MTHFALVAKRVFCSTSLFALVLTPLSAADPPIQTAREQSTEAKVAAISGEELFSREWLPNDPRSHGGDGLGPVFNGSSCVSCHNLAGQGGAGALSKNVDLITAANSMVRFSRRPGTNPLARIHPGFAKSSTVVLHKFGIDAQHGQWRQRLLTTSPFQTTAAFLGGPSSNSAPFVAQDTLESFPAEAVSQAGPSTEPVQPQRRPGPLNSIPAADELTAEDVFSEPEPPQTQPNTEQRGSSDRRFRSQRQEPRVQQPGAAAEFEPQAPAVDPAPITRPTPNPGLAPAARQPAPPVQQPFVQPQSFGPPSAQFSQPLPPGISPAMQQALPSVSVSSQSPMLNRAISKIAELTQQTRKDLARQTSLGGQAVQHSQRNTPALFGAGLIDRIPDAVLHAAAEAKFEDNPAVTGRVARDQDGNVGRFGWKAQKPSLEEFTRAACAVELGLHVPGHAQAGTPYKPDEKPKGLDLDEKQLQALNDYIAQLARPAQRKPKDERAAKVIDDGEELFNSVGCAACHVKKLGNVDGLYGDLLLHDMGPQLGGTGSYGVFTPSNPGADQVAEEQARTRSPNKRAIIATPTEWRTPPLWGVRDSAPYLHDGRATTLEQAIALHGGESADSTVKFFMLSPSKQQKVIAFLKTLAAPKPEQQRKPQAVKTAAID